MTSHLMASTVTAVVALAVVFALRRRGAAVRYAILLVALLRFAVPTGWLLEGGARVAGLVPAEVRVAAMPVVRELASPLMPRSEVGDGLVASGSVDGARSWSWKPVLLGVWAVGTALCLGLWGRRVLRRVPAVREATEEERSAFAEARRRLEVRGSVGLRVVDAGCVPGALGWWRSVVLLPEGLSEELSAAELDAVLAHELAHVRRRDNLWAAVARVVAGVFWFHPLVWWMERRMLAERETACDEMVLAAGADPEDYVRGISKVCRTAFAHASAYAGITGSNLRTRMEYIMSVKLAGRLSWRMRALPAVLAVAAVLLPVGAGYLQAQDSSYADQLFEKGYERFQAGDYESAIVIFRELHEQYPNDIRGMVGGVESLMSLGKDQEAILNMAQAVEREPERKDLRVALGNLLVRAERYDEALQLFGELLERDPNDASLMFRMAETYRRKGDVKAATEYFRKASAVAPEDVNAHLQLALLLDGTGRKSEAQVEYARVLEINPGHPVALNNLAYMESEQPGADLDLELERAQLASATLPESADVMDTVGTIHLKRGEVEEAIAQFEAALEKGFDNAGLQGHLAEALDRTTNLTPERQELRVLLRREAGAERDARIKELLGIE